MQMDVQALFSDAQAITTGTQYSTNTVDLGAVGLQSNGVAPNADFGAGTPKEILVQVVQTFTGGTSLNVELVMADTADQLTGTVALGASGVVPEASLVVGYQLNLQYVPHGVTKRYLGLRYTSVGTHGAGKIAAGFVMSRQRY